ncbi:MAG: MerR family DNA-binding transcriptional regulator, partial [Candidatus Dormibacteria bacterium]
MAPGHGTGRTVFSISRFSLATGLTQRTLRHYDEIGLLKPVSVDPVTGYRSFN